MCIGVPMRVIESEAAMPGATPAASESAWT